MVRSLRAGPPRHVTFDLAPGARVGRGYCRDTRAVPSDLMGLLRGRMCALGPMMGLVRAWEDLVFCTACGSVR